MVKRVSYLLIFLMLLPITFSYTLEFTNTENLTNAYINSTPLTSSVSLRFNFSSSQTQTRYLYFYYTSFVNFSSNLTQNQSLEINLTNMRNGNTSTIHLNSSSSSNEINLEYGYYKLEVRSNFASSKRLLIKKKPSLSLNFTKISYYVYNKILSENSSSTYQFYVDNSSISKIEIYLKLNNSGNNEVNFSLLFPDKNLANFTLLSSDNATLLYENTSNFPEGYWSIKIQNLNQSAIFKYNLTISLEGSNLSYLGNISKDFEKIVLTYNVNEEEGYYLEDYTSQVKIGNSTNYTLSNLTFIPQKPTLILNETFLYFGDTNEIKLVPGKNNTYKQTKKLYVNVNQSKSISFSICNYGNLTLYLTETNSTNFTKVGDSLVLNYTLSLPASIPPNSCENLTINLSTPINSSYIGTYLGWINISSNSSLPYKTFLLNLSLEVVNQSYLKLFLSPSSNIFGKGQNITFTLTPYTYDEEELLNLSYSNLTLNVTGAQSKSILLTKNLYNYTNTTYFTQLGNYTANSICISGEVYGCSNNKTFTISNLLYIADKTNYKLFNPGDILQINFTAKFADNLTFDPYINTSYYENKTVKLYPEQGYTSEYYNLRISIGTFKKIGNEYIFNTSSLPQNFVGGNFTLKLENLNDTYGNSGTLEAKVRINNSFLKASISGISDLEVNESDTYTVTIYNYGTRDALVNITLDSCSESYLDTDAYYSEGYDDNYNNILIPAGGYNTTTFKVKAKKAKDSCEVRIEIEGGAWWAGSAYHNASSYTYTEDITIEGSSEEQSQNSETQTNYYELSFLEPSDNTIEISQGGKYSLKVKIKNTGNIKLDDVYLEIENLTSSWYSISPTTKQDLDSLETREFYVNFTIPKNAEIKTYTFYLKAKSNQVYEKKTMYLIVREAPTLKFENLPVEISIVQGANKTLSFKIKNIGNITAHNINLSLQGISSYSFSENNFNISKKEEKETSLTITLSKNEALGEKTIFLYANYDEDSVNISFKLKVLPSEETKNNIKNTYTNYLTKYAQLYSQYLNLTKTGNEDEDIQNLLNEINTTLSQISGYLKNEDYLKANNLLSSLSQKFNLLNAKLSSLKEIGEENQNSSFAFYIIIAFVISIVIIASFLALSQRKSGFKPGKGFYYKTDKGIFDKIKERIDKYFEERRAKRILSLKEEELLKKWKKKEKK